MTHKVPPGLSLHWCGSSVSMNNEHGADWDQEQEPAARFLVPIEMINSSGIDLGGSRIMAESPDAPNAPIKGAGRSYVGSGAVGTSKAAAAIHWPQSGTMRSTNAAAGGHIGHSLSDGVVARFPFFCPASFRPPSSRSAIPQITVWVWIRKGSPNIIWVDRRPDRIFIIYARCTALSCTPGWKPAGNKFKCPCHGSGYDDEGSISRGQRPTHGPRLALAPTAKSSAGHLPPLSVAEGRRVTLKDYWASEVARRHPRGER